MPKKLLLNIDVFYIHEWENYKVYTNEKTIQYTRMRKLYSIHEWENYTVYTNEKELIDKIQICRLFCLMNKKFFFRICLSEVWSWSWILMRFNQILKKFSSDFSLSFLAFLALNDERTYGDSTGLPTKY